MPSRKKPTAARPKSIHVLHVQLMGSRPTIWREVQVPSDTPLSKLHAILQAAFGWTNSHMHMFEDEAGKQYGTLTDDDFGEPPLDERKYTVADLAPKAKDALGYIYDFGDDWVHRVEVSAVQPPEPDVKYPACTAGARAAPLEDCGGIEGYARLLKILKNPKHSEHQELLEWAGGPIDAAAFDLKAADKAVRSARSER